VNNILQNKSSLIFLFSCAVLLLISTNYLFIPIAALFFVFCILLIPVDKMLPLIIVLLVAIPGDVGSLIRGGILIFSVTILLIFIYQKRHLLKSYFELLDRKLLKLIALFLASMFISTIFSQMIMQSLTEIIRQVSFLFILVIFFFYIDSRKSILSVIYSLIIAGFLVSFSQIIQIVLYGGDFISLVLSGLGHFSGYYNNVSAIGGLLSVSIPLLFYYYKVSKRSNVRVLILILLVIEIFGLFLTDSRGAFLSLSVSALCFLVINEPQKLKKILPIVLLFIVAIGSLLLTNETFNLYFRTTRILENTRYLLWQIAFGVFADSPILGIGPGMFTFYMYKYLPVMLGTWEERQIDYIYTNSSTGQTHNFLLMKATELGTIGLIISIALLGYIFVQTYSLIKMRINKKDDTYDILVIIISIFCGLVARSFIEATGLLTNGWISRDLPFWLLVATVFRIKSSKNIFSH